MFCFVSYISKVTPRLLAEGGENSRILNTILQN
jgi:hypothetical protein